MFTEIKTPEEQEHESQKNTQKSSEDTSAYLLDKLKTKETKIDNKKNEIKSKEKQIEVKNSGEDIDYADILEKIAYGLLIIGGVALVGLIATVAIFTVCYPVIPPSLAIVYQALLTAFGTTAAVGIFAGGLSYISKFFVDITQTFARTKFKGSSPAKSKEPEIKKEAPKLSTPDPPKKVQSQTEDIKPKQNNQDALKIRSNTTKSTPQQI